MNKLEKAGLRESIKIAKEVKIPKSDEFQNFLKKNNLILTDERELIIPLDWKLLGRSPFMGDGSGISHHCIVCDSLKRDRIVIWPDKLIVCPRFYIVEPVTRIKKGRLDKVRVAIYDRKLVESYNKFDGDPITKIIFEETTEMPESTTEKEKKEIKEKLLSNLINFIKEKYPDYENPYAYWG